MTAIIIDDMELARAALRQALAEALPDLDIVGEADGVVSGSKLLRQTQPDILFLDIHLGDGEGFDILEIVPDIRTKVIFTTASDEHAVKAFRYAAVDYLLKPVSPEQLAAAIARAANQPEPHSDQYQLLRNGLSDQSNTTQRLALHTSEQILLVEVSDIVRMEASGNYTQFFFKNGKKLLITKTLKEFDKTLNGDGFVRTHQSHLVNIDYVKAFVKTEGGYIEMKDASMVPVSVRKRASVVEALSSIS